MKAIIIIFILITTPVFAGIVKIETGETDIKDKLAKIGATANSGRPSDEWRIWTLANSDNIIEITVYKENLVENIIAWNNADYNLHRSMVVITREDADHKAEESGRHRVRSISFDTDTKSIQIEKFSGTIHIAVGDTDVIDKLKNAGAHDLWNTRALYFFDPATGKGKCTNEGPKNVDWSLIGSNDTSKYIRVGVATPEGRVSSISFWNSPMKNLVSEYKDRRYAQSFTYNADNKTLQVDKNTEVVKINVGDTDVMDKLLKIGAKDAEHLKDTGPQPEKNTLWTVSDFDVTVDVCLDKDRVADIYFWYSADVRATKTHAMDSRHYAQSLSYDTANRNIQVKGNTRELNRQPATSHAISDGAFVFDYTSQKILPNWEVRDRSEIIPATYDMLHISSSTGLTSEWINREPEDCCSRNAEWRARVKKFQDSWEAGKPIVCQGDDIKLIVDALTGALYTNDWPWTYYQRFGALKVVIANPEPPDRFVQRWMSDRGIRLFYMKVTVSE